ncbi:hypothetical protein JTE90_015025 [Oedothorax gibbosus]|uniref:IRF tryptophan pentad repeat domain-containing protein n=1 Tax=Oedothorax gibbosus TaxID=931172 RepID=A0AAV6TWV4_9ARAC|nr:hypothetical protein JTE90_015025 [Oedothorax gibbosus]
MSRKLLMRDFVLPALNDQRYGDVFRWLNPKKEQFVLRWRYLRFADNPNWIPAEAAIFQDWDEMKGRPEKNSIMTAKQRFLAALKRQKSLKIVPSQGDKIFEIVKNEEVYCTQTSIPTPVICINPHYVPKM